MKLMEMVIDMLVISLEMLKFHEATEIPRDQRKEQPKTLQRIAQHNQLLKLRWILCFMKVKVTQRKQFAVET